MATSALGTFLPFKVARLCSRCTVMFSTRTLLLILSVTWPLQHGAQAWTQALPHANPVLPQEQTPEAPDSLLLSEIHALRVELADIKTLLLKQQQLLPTGASRAAIVPDEPPHEEVVLPFLPVERMGSEDAPFVVVEFADLQCPFCIYFEQHSLTALITRRVDTGQIGFMSVDFPLPSHPDATRLSLASICAGDQGKYWEMRAALMTSNFSIKTDSVSRVATTLGLRSSSFNSCVASTSRLEAISEQAATVRGLGISGTPTFLVGIRNGTTIRGKLIVGAASPDDFIKQVDQITATYNSEGNHDIATIPSASAAK